MKFQVGDLFVYQDNHTPATLLLIIKIEHEYLFLEFGDQEGVTAIGKYRIDLIEKNYLKNGCWKYYPVVK